MKGLVDIALCSKQTTAVVNTCEGFWKMQSKGLVLTKVDRVVSYGDDVALEKSFDAETVNTVCSLVISKKKVVRSSFQYIIPALYIMTTW